MFVWLEVSCFVLQLCLFIVFGFWLDLSFSWFGTIVVKTRAFILSWWQNVTMISFLTTIKKSTLSHSIIDYYYTPHYYSTYRSETATNHQHRGIYSWASTLAKEYPLFCLFCWSFLIIRIITIQLYYYHHYIITITTLSSLHYNHHYTSQYFKF